MTGTLTTIDTWAPNRPQTLAKARFERRLAERAGLVDLAALTLDEIQELAGDKRVRTWLADPSFAAWFTNRDTFVDQAVSMKELALEAIEEILTAERGDGRDGTVTAKDKLAAAKELLSLTGAYPRKEVVRFADRDLDGMPDDEVARQLAEAKQKLTARGGT